MASRLTIVNETQIRLAEKLYTGAAQVKRLQESYERLVNVTCTKHSTHDAVFYICDEGAIGFRAVKFYNDSSDYRIGAHYPSLAEAYSDALVYL